jgi:hypothetical protein
MNAETQLIIAPGTSDRMKKIVQSIPPYDLLLAYRQARHAFRTPDIVLVVNQENEEGLMAFPRDAYLEKAFKRWTAKQKKVHPVAKAPAHKSLQMPLESNAFWLAVELPKEGAVAYAAIGAMIPSKLVAN